MRRRAGFVPGDRDARYMLFNRNRATTNIGAELLATVRRGPWVDTSTYAYMRSREDGHNGPQDVALTPRDGAGFVGMWEEKNWGLSASKCIFPAGSALK